MGIQIQIGLMADLGHGPGSSPPKVFIVEGINAMFAGLGQASIAHPYLSVVQQRTARSTFNKSIPFQQSLSIEGFLQTLGGAKTANY